MFTQNDALEAETYYAKQLHVPEALAHAIASVESGHDPYAKGDYVGGEPTSFGDYQLHRGGLLGSLSAEQAFDPWTNARVALTHLAETRRRYPSVRDPGALAALSQGPANRDEYRRRVNAAMQTGGAGGPSSAGAQTTELASFWGDVMKPGDWVWDKVTGGGGYVLRGAGDVGGAIAAPFVALYNLFRGIWDFFTSADTWIRIGLFAGGFVLILAGARVAFGTTASPRP